MGGYLSSKREKDDKEDQPESKRKKIDGKDVGILKSKEYQIVYDAGPVRLEDLPPHMRSMFVFKKMGSMFFDEDGDLAHEFYVEARRKHASRGGVVRWTMKQILHNLKPEGDVDLPIPRLRTSVPIVLLDSNAVVVPR